MGNLLSSQWEASPPYGYRKDGVGVGVRSGKVVKPLELAKRVATLGPGECRGDGPLTDTL